MSILLKQGAIDLNPNLGTGAPQSLEFEILRQGLPRRT
jgi:hypothetical protein